MSINLSDRSIRSIASNSALSLAVIVEPSGFFKFLFSLDFLSWLRAFKRSFSAASKREVKLLSKMACLISAPILTAALPYSVPSAKANCSNTPFKASISSFLASRCWPLSSGNSLANEASIAIITGSFVSCPAVGLASGSLGIASSFAINSSSCSLLSIVPISCSRVTISLKPWASLPACMFSEKVVPTPRRRPMSFTFS